LAALLQLVEVVFHLFGVEVSRQALEVQCHGGHMSAVVVEGARRPAEYTYVALKALQQSFKPCYLTAGTVQVLVPS
jgi:hypothetical protein